MITARFTRQTEVSAVLDSYIGAYLDGSSSVFFNEMRKVTAPDGADVFFASPDAVLAGNAHAGPLRISLAERILDCAAYYAAQGIPLGGIPREIRICMPVNHCNVHWTGVVVTVPSFSTLMENVYANCDLSSGNFNRVRKEIENVLDFKKEYTADERTVIEEELNIADLGEDSTYTQEQVELIQDFLLFKREDSNDERADKVLGQVGELRLRHADSLNQEKYHDRVKEGFGALGDRMEEAVCSVQQGNTCGDHTAINLFGMGVFDQIPRVNSGAEGDLASTDLRQFTNSIPRSEADIALFGALPAAEDGSTRKCPEDVIAEAKSILDKVSVHSPAASKASSGKEKESMGSTTIFDSMLNDFVFEVSNLLSELQAKVGPEALELLHNAIQFGGKGVQTSQQVPGHFVDRYNKEHPEQPVKRDDLDRIFKTLLDAFSGIHPLTERVSEEDRMVFGGLAQVFVCDSCIEMVRSSPRASVSHEMAPAHRDATPARQPVSGLPAASGGISLRRIIAGVLMAVAVGLAVTVILFPPAALIAGIFAGLAWIASISMGISTLLQNRTPRAGGGGASAGNGPVSGSHARIHTRLGSEPSPERGEPPSGSPSPPSTKPKPESRGHSPVPSPESKNTPKPPGQ